MAIRGCVASTKTFAMAVLVHAWLQAYHPSRVYTTAPSFRQVELVMWPEIRGLHKRAMMPIGGKLLGTELYFDDDWFARGFSTDDPQRLHGFHGRHILFIIDEAQGVSQEILEAIENIMADGEAHLVLLGNPSLASGVFFDAFHSQASRYHQIKISAMDTPNYQQRRVVVPGMITYEQVQEWLRMFGPDSDFFRVKALGEFPRQDAMALVPLDWIERAFLRWEKLPFSLGDPVDLGVDVARSFKAARSVILPLAGAKVLEPKAEHWPDTMETAGWVVKMHRDLQARGGYVDICGLGAGVYDRVREQNLDIAGFNGSLPALDPEKYFNRRSEAWWGVREALDPKGEAPLGLPPGEVSKKIQEQLCAVKWKLDSKGRIRVESKEEMIARLGVSPDEADALTYAVAARGAGGPIPGATATPSVEALGTNAISRLTERAGTRARGGASVGGLRRLRGI